MAIVKSDICIVGAGVVGATLAVLLSQKGFKVTLVERKPLPKPDALDISEYDLRVFAINAASKALFQQCGVWHLIEQLRVSPYTGMKVWDAESNGMIEFSADNIYQNELGHIIEQKVILEALSAKIRDSVNISVVEECELSTMYNDTEGAKLILKKPNKMIHAKLLVGADGSQSWVRNNANISLVSNAYNHSAIVATVRTEKPHLKIARQRFRCDGPLALLPLKGAHDCSIVWSTHPQKVAYLTELDQQTFSEALTYAFGDNLGTLSLKSKRVSFPLMMQHAKTYCQPGLALVGDAAHVIHPLAGLGVNIGLRNIRVLVEKLVSQHNKCRDLNSIAYLRKYERQERSHATMIITLMQAFKEGFGTENRLIKAARNMGLNFTNRHQLLKNQFIKLAMDSG